MNIRLLLFLFLLLYGVTSSFAQFQTNNDASALGGDIYQLTPALNNQGGSIWYQLEHDLRTPFTVAGQLYFGTDDAGADGIAFVMQNNCLNAGTFGGGIGYANMPGQSIAVEFDTYENTLATGAFDNSDPSYDHIAVIKQGVVNHADAINNLYGPIQAHATKANIEDGVWYDFQISYDPATQELRVFFDGTLRFTYNYDVLNQVFLGDPYVYWGFTSSTGGFFNDQQVFIDKDLTTFTLSDATLCPPNSVTVQMPSLSRLAGQNMALGKTAVASSTISSASEAVDGNVATRWESIQGNDPEWMYVDLGSVQDLDSVIIHWEAAYASQYQLQVSTDALAWTTVYTETNVNRLNTYPANNLRDTVVVSVPNIRYVRMLGTARSTIYGYSIWEFQIYATPKYVWSPNDGSIDNIYSENPTFTPAVTTTYTVMVPNDCGGAIPYNMTITVDCSLPVQLISFDAVRVNDHAHLTWTTSTERNVKDFTIMKSMDGIHFHPIGKVAAQGNSLSLKSYSFDDPDLPRSGTVYYQLLTTDFDGSTQESPIRQLILKNKGVLITSPVFEEETTLILPSEEIKLLKLTVVDALGRVLLQEYHPQPSGSISFGKTLPPTANFYIAIVQTETINQTFKLVKR